ncbi:hypothetical protein [Xenorhabdus bovienii]|uniref:hypothetical protein n=1 Tax=Xenorhabdus bovienii TaxID=40576 RepID=UPI0023B229C4|nr:hypothetical protein [Xenorhabdus bovienii]MDE9459718.1 hypothetical protein [Xenorhabdus bovienii]MDE9488100.1 hypothetical protein [Xenorhabdus bovienii]MDE9516047.1 hypothetical protein [Xenorhabdus bovienii]
MTVLHCGVFSTKNTSALPGISGTSENADDAIAINTPGLCFELLLTAQDIDNKLCRFIRPGAGVYLSIFVITPVPDG